ncbi:MAG: autoinducer binding domain-containing protein [Ralstonia sp.]|uniref:Autoinducer binding domain-containing protein n=2 Tax=Pseudomonadota TaxID=1224 RepID=A0A9Q3LMG3_RALPI|nr:autoinducer binding domain-containing protein [Ralstonia pickettii]MBA9843959.1 LuxR family transcriptional regulator [Ralstonia pickettii]MBA9849837.1 LuxR family transcriptional regulator [Ralstonia pickettii]MBA9876752.1 LuxR family transcriptional regulator [Ralstonia pickettii]MBA9880596.1 LuxR family transcriptional regulator [Ralstonia pickettii]MBA9886560.1 LuxR family transcriptional regulator [Ralstonia pickettii]
MGAHNQLPHDRATAWRAALLHQLNGLRDADAVIRSLQPAVALLGFDYCAYALRAAIPITRFNTLCWSTYPEPWCEHYRVHGYLAIDPVLQFGQRCVKPVLWSGIATADARFWADARQHGLNHGWSHTIRDHTGIFGTFSLVRRATPITEDELAASEPEMIWLSQHAHASISTLMAEKVLPDAATRLKEVERQTLHWTAEGKTAAEVAAILEMTERNVNFHIRNAVTKLNAANKTHAVVKAALLGLIPATL